MDHAKYRFVDGKDRGWFWLFYAVEPTRYQQPSCQLYFDLCLLSHFRELLCVMAVQAQNLIVRMEGNAVTR